ncbi:MAG: PD-(D/E)XK nuclease family protein [Chloroherpetonaceae bacterium]|nr:PD-(D/E)XK nuclease family protein [Chthonomonadaceae bacterium]MDW8209144.1 PD-(D/E)XK nuclease family protein [Chloroherpetonaceae bacterium]
MPEDASAIPQMHATDGRKPVLSPTRITTYLECALKYRFIYVDRVGRYFLRARSYHSFGNTLHQVLQSFHAGGGKQSVEEMTRELAHRWISAGYVSRAQEQQHRELGQQILTTYHQQQQERDGTLVRTIATEKTITCDMGPFKLLGRVDRIDEHPDGTLEIIDYKSGRLETSPEQVAGDLAMNIYQLILSRLYPDRAILGTIYCLRSGVQASASQTAEEREAFAQDILALGQEILSRDYSTVFPIPLAICPDCDFLPICQQYWEEHGRG